VAKGVEEQTEKLVQVCRMRHTPIIVFINKLDREGKDAFDLLDEIETKLNLRVTPLSWPIGMGQSFQGVYSLYEKKIIHFKPHGKQDTEEVISIHDLKDPKLEQIIGARPHHQLLDEIHTVESVYPAFHREDYLSGKICPVFYGSAVNNFGVRELLDCFVEIAPEPLYRETEERIVQPEEQKLSGFVFKIHANMDPKHRDRIAFFRICSGVFKRNTNYFHVRLNRQLKFSNPTSFMAARKEVVEEAYPGDVVGLFDSGNFKIGDSLTEGESLHFKGIPRFSPEIFRYVNNADPSKFKQFAKGLDQLMDEGVAQMFIKEDSQRKIIGVVGALQFDVIQYRMEHEYNAACNYDPINLHKALWVECADVKKLDEFITRRKKDLARDKDGKLIFLAESAWTLKLVQENFPDLKFHMSSEF
ncbi:MAG: peptide chain release factor 3, partial [Saprospiraceae bacterium]